LGDGFGCGCGHDAFQQLSISARFRLFVPVHSGVILSASEGSRLRERPFLSVEILPFGQDDAAFVQDDTALTNKKPFVPVRDERLVALPRYHPG